MYSNSKTLKKHIQAVHKKIKPFSCNVCGHSSSSKHTLQVSYIYIFISSIWGLSKTRQFIYHNKIN